MVMGWAWRYCSLGEEGSDEVWDGLVGVLGYGRVTKGRETYADDEIFGVDEVVV